MRPVQLGDVSGFEGKWVALKDHRVVAAGTTPDSVVETLRREAIEGATILRVGAENEPESVGLG
jgi:hypothetical protein